MIQNNFNCWLTGLIEGDGSIIIPSSLRDSKNRLLYPHIRIAFHKKDYELVNKIKNKLNYGNIIKIKTSNTILYTISSKLEILDLINRLNGNMRTPKIHRLHLLIDWYNKNHNTNIIKLDIDNTNINDNSWLSGMSDADSNFNIIISKRKGNNFRIQRQWRLEFSQKTYHGKDQLYWGMLISNYLNTTLYSRSRLKKNKLYSSFIVVAYNISSIDILNNYFKKYPLKSSKYLDYKVWLLCKDLEIKYKNNKKQLLKEIQSLKNQMNNNRKQFNWDHLNDF